MFLFAAKSNMSPFLYPFLGPVLPPRYRMFVARTMTGKGSSASWWGS